MRFVAVAATYIFCGVGTLVILFVIDKTLGLRAESDDERMGLDLSQHSETAYQA